jgi:hypothetical protein
LGRRLSESPDLVRTPCRRGKIENQTPIFLQITNFFPDIINGATTVIVYTCPEALENYTKLSAVLIIYITVNDSRRIQIYWSVE